MASSLTVKFKMAMFPKISLLIQIPIFHGSGSVINRSELKPKLDLLCHYLPWEMSFYICIMMCIGDIVGNSVVLWYYTYTF